MTIEESITVTELAARHQREPVELIDVRTSPEFREVRAAPARSVPLDELDPHTVMQNRPGGEDRPVYVICKSGRRGEKARQKFISAGFTNVCNIEGGTEAWEAAGLPVVRGQKAVSLERQVRIAAGFIVFVGAVSAMVTGNVWLAGIPAFVGAGLMFAGITDTCAMGMLIAKMPWNRTKSDSAACPVPPSGSAAGTVR